MAQVVLEMMTEEFGNAGSRTHAWGAEAKRRLQQARLHLADLAAATPDEVLFTSGATESNNLAILGLAHGNTTHHKKHILSSSTEHKAVLEPLERLRELGFEIELIDPGADGLLSPDDVMRRVRSDTLLVSLMLVNNETGVIQQVDEISKSLRKTSTLLHVDAAQGFAKPTGQTLSDVDLISISGHKLGAPKGVGAMITRKRGWYKPPISPLMYGGGQERGLRPGTVPVPLAVGLAMAATELEARSSEWEQGCREFRKLLVEHLQDIPHQVNGNALHTVPQIINIWFQGVDAEALIVNVKDLAAIATGSACTSAHFTPSHVLLAMGMDEVRALQSVRISWWDSTDPSVLPALVDVVKSLRFDA